MGVGLHVEGRSLIQILESTCAERYLCWRQLAACGSLVLAQSSQSVLGWRRRFLKRPLPNGQLDGPRASVQGVTITLKLSQQIASRLKGMNFIRSEHCSARENLIRARVFRATDSGSRISTRCQEGLQGAGPAFPVSW